MIPGGVDLIGQIGISPFLTGLAEIDEFYGLPVQEALVQSPHAHDAGGFAPVTVLLQGDGKLFLLLALNHPGDVGPRRVLQAEAVVERHQVEDLEVAGGRHQRAVEIIGHAVQVIHRTEISAQGTLHSRLQALVLCLEDGFGFGR